MIKCPEEKTNSQLTLLIPGHTLTEWISTGIHPRGCSLCLPDFLSLYLSLSFPPLPCTPYTGHSLLLGHLVRTSCATLLHWPCPFPSVSVNVVSQVFWGFDTDIFGASRPSSAGFASSTGANPAAVMCVSFPLHCPAHVTARPITGIACAQIPTLQSCPVCNEKVISGRVL